MAQEPSQGGLPNIGVDPMKAPLYGEGTDEYMQTIQKAQEDAIKALQDRYANPNWFKIAAGFAKPQLGGFLASLGSASEAFGENIEQERAQQFPIQQLKMQMAQTGALMKNTKTVNDEIRKWTSENPNQIPPDYMIQDWAGRAPDSAGVKSLAAQKKDYMDKLGITNKSQELKLQAAQLTSANNQLLLTGLKTNLADLKDTWESGSFRGTKEDYLEQRQAITDQIKKIQTTPLPVPTWDEPPSNAADVEKRKKLEQAGTAGTDIFPPAMTGTANEPQTVSTKSQKPVLGVDDTTTVSPKKSAMSGKSAPSSSTDANAPSYSYVSQLPPLSGEPASTYAQKAEAAKARAKTEEDNTNTLIAPYLKANDPSLSTNYFSAIKDLQLIQKDPELQKGYATIHNLLRKASPLATAAQEGLTANFGGYGASFSVPVTAYQRAKLPEKYWPLADRVLSNYNTLATAHATLDGISKVPATNQENFWAKYAHLGKTPDEAYRSVNDNMFDFAMQQEIGRRLPEIQSRILAEHPDELAPKTAAWRSDEVKKIRKAFDDAHDIERRKHNLARQQANKP